MTENPYTAELIFSYFQSLSEKQKEQFEKLGALYSEWNSRINVISRKDIDNIYPHHILHSLAIAKYIQSKSNIGEDGMEHVSFKKGTKVFDIGTGGGFPGIPLAIFYPDVDFLLCDSVGKKLKVVQAVADALQLQNVSVVHARAEEIDGQFDYIISRAVTDLQNFLPWVKGRYEKGILYLKGGDISDNDDFSGRGALMQEIDIALKKNGLSRKHLLIYNLSECFNDSFFEEKRLILIKKQPITKI